MMKFYSAERRGIMDEALVLPCDGGTTCFLSIHKQERKPRNSLAKGAGP